jgi:diacylglycerol kinase (ATP)
MTDARQRVTVLVNTTARGSARERWQPAVDVLETAAAVTVFAPQSASAMEAAAVAAARGDVSAIVVVGGDGTVNRVVHAVAGLERCPPLGLIPLGTGNDLARALGVPRDPADAARRVLAGRTVAMDVVTANGRTFCTAGVLGVPASAALEVREWLAPGSAMRTLAVAMGGFSYTVAGLRHVLHPGVIAERYEIRHAGGLWSVRSPGVFIANTSALGGGLILPLGSDATDGVVEIAVIADLSRPRLLAAFARFARGWPLPPGTLTTVKASRVEIQCEGVRRFSADGDLLGESDRWDVAVVPAALRVFI